MDIFGAVLSVLALVGTAVVLYHLHRITRTLARVEASSLKLQNDYKDALRLISDRADRQEKRSEQVSSEFASLASSLNDRRAVEAQLVGSHAATKYLQDQNAKLQEAVLALADAKVSAQLSRQSKAEEPEKYVAPVPSRWEQASGVRRAEIPVAVTTTTQGRG